MKLPALSSVEAQLRNLEEELLMPLVRRNPETISRLLADDFREFGSSGRIFDKHSVVNELLTELSGQISMADFRVNMLAPGAALVTYVATRSDERGRQVNVALRSSIWILREGGWRILFHQGTNVPN